MPTRGADGTGDRPQGLGAAVKAVAEHASSLARLEVELAGAELARKAKAFAVGIGLGLGAILFLLFAIGFALATAAVAIALWLSTWLALLIVTGGTVLIALVLGALAAAYFKRGTPPVPEQAIAEAKRTRDAIKPHEH